MNIFTEYGDYHGKTEAASLNQTMRELTDLAVTMRRQLGDRGHLLEEYFCCLLEGAGAVTLFTAAETGFNSGMELRALCKSVARDTTAHAEHPLYEKAREYISAHPFPNQDIYTRHSLHYVALSGDFAEYAADKYAHTIKATVNKVVDLARVDELYREICAALGGDGDMERFNLLFRQRFFGVTMMAGFLQGMTDNVIAELLSRDAESSKQMVRLWLDESLKGDE